MKRALETCIGLEIHAQLNTPKKLFSGAPFDAFGPPNAQLAYFDAALPGAMPKLNPECIRLAARAAIALNSQINNESQFDRKHYFYPDLPAGYQITQKLRPFATGGSVRFGQKSLLLEQIQIEQDSGKILVQDDKFIDLNRMGIGVIEIVTRPDLKSTRDTIDCLRHIQRLLWYNQVITADMDHGAFRSDVNVSVRYPGSPLSNRVELKHLVKFSWISAALDYEIKRQSDLVNAGQVVEQETRGYDPGTKTTFKLRDKEDVQDYNYMRDADIPLLRVSQEFIDSVKCRMPEKLEARTQRLHDRGLSSTQIELLMNEPGAVEYLEAVLDANKTLDTIKTANWIVVDVYGWLKMRDLRIQMNPVSPIRLEELLSLTFGGKVSGLQAKRVLHLMMDGDQRNALDIIKDNGWLQESDESRLSELCDSVIAKHPDLVRSLTQIEKIKGGKDRLLGFLVGQVMQATKGSADPVLVSKLLKQKIL